MGARLICGNSWNTACYKSEPKTLHFVSKAVFPVAVHDGWVDDSFSYFLLRSLRKYLKQITPAKLRFHVYCMFYNWWLYRRTQHWWALVAVRFQMFFMLFSPGLPSTTNVVMSFFVCSDSRIEYLWKCRMKNATALWCSPPENCKIMSVSKFIRSHFEPKMFRFLHIQSKWAAVTCTCFCTTTALVSRGVLIHCTLITDVSSMQFTSFILH